ncbi:MAG: hypothetical protein JWQ40_2464 [Segetibacter sp.]|nr:hypothetical protein [Segetibacter sp.]
MKPIILRIRISLLLIVLSFSFTLVFGQESYENKHFGIKISKPKDWVLATNDDLDNSLKKIEFSNEQLIKVLNSNKGVVTLVSYYKYKTDSVSGLIPTVKITIRNNPTSNYSDFKQVMIESTNRVKTVVRNFEFIDNFKEVKVSEYAALFYSCRYSFSLASGDTMKVRSRYYMIPKDKYFISISLMDNETNENSSQLYNQLMNSLELTK